MARNIVRGQNVDEGKVMRARQLRRQMTAPERALWQELRANKLGGYHFRRQQVIGGFIVDFYCHGASLVVEVDGPLHESTQAYDAERDATLAERGLRVVRFSVREVEQDLPAVLAAILQACRGAPNPPTPLP